MSRPPKAASRTSSMHILGALTLASSVTSNRWALLQMRQLRGSPIHPVAMRVSHRGDTPRRNALPQRPQTFLGRWCSLNLKGPFTLGPNPRLVVREGPAQMGVPGREALPFAFPSSDIAFAGFSVPVSQLARPLMLLMLPFTAMGSCGFATMPSTRLFTSRTSNVASRITHHILRRPKPRNRPTNSTCPSSARPARRRAADFVRPRRGPSPTNFVQLARTTLAHFTTIEAASIRWVKVVSGVIVSAGSGSSVYGYFVSNLRRVQAPFVAASICLNGSFVRRP